MEHETKWHPFPEELPPKEGLYIVCCNNGDLSLKYFVKEVKIEYVVKGTTVFDSNHMQIYTRQNAFLNSKQPFRTEHTYKTMVSDKVAYWTEAPIPPRDTNKTAYEIRKLTAKIEELQRQLKQYEED